MRAVIRTFAAMTTLAILGGSGPLAAQAGSKTAAPTGVKIGYVDSRLIMRSAPGFAQAESTYNKEMDGYRAQVQQLQSTFDSLASDFEQSSVMLSPTQRTAKRKELEAKQADLEQQTQDLQQKAAARERELLDPIQQKVNSLIEQIRQEGNYAMIFDAGSPTSSIVAADKTLDLTDRVIARLKSGK